MAIEYHRNNCHIDHFIFSLRRGESYTYVPRIQIVNTSFIRVIRPLRGTVPHKKKKKNPDEGRKILTFPSCKCKWFIPLVCKNVDMSSYKCKPLIPLVCTPRQNISYQNAEFPQITRLLVISCSLLNLNGPRSTAGEGLIKTEHLRKPSKQTRPKMCYSRGESLLKDEKDLDYILQNDQGSIRQEISFYEILKSHQISGLLPPRFVQKRILFEQTSLGNLNQKMNFADINLASDSYYKSYLRIFLRIPSILLSTVYRITICQAVTSRVR